MIDGRYQIERKLGSGGMAQVYLGIYLKTGVKVAIKLLDSSLSSDMAVQRRCLDEARAMMELQSSHVVRALDVGSLPSGQLYIVMEYLDGEDLNALLVREGPLPWPRVGDMAVQICSGLATAHRRGIIHRDIKPQNCFRVTVDDNPEHIKIIDFGVARDLKGEAGPTQDGFLIGTPEYTAPELVRGMAKASARTDIYALGVMLYKLLTGTVPFQGATPVETLRKHVGAPLQPPSRAAPHLEIPPAADEIIERALARDPERRFASAEELSRAIKSALGLQRSGVMAQPQGLEAPPRSDAPARRPEAIAPATRPPPAPPLSLALPDRAHPGTAVDPTKDAAQPVAIRPRPVPPQTRGDPSGEEFRSVDRKSVGLRLVSLMSLSLLFVVGTKLVSPVMPVQARPGETDPPPPGSDDALLAAAPSTPGPAEGLEHPEKPQTESEPAKTEPELPPDTVDDSPPKAPPPAEEAAPVREPEPLFDYTDAKKLIDDEVDYLRKTCLARAKQPTTRLKFRVDVRATGWPVVKIFSIDSAVRACVRGLFVFPFKRSPRGGAFVYSLSDAGTSIQKMPLELEEKSE